MARPGPSRPRPPAAALVPGRIPALECLRAGKRRPHKLYLLHGGKGLDPLRAAAQVPIEDCSRAELDALLPGELHQGVILEADPLPVWPAAEWLARAFPPDALVLILDGIEDPHNFGAIVRSGAACGVRGVMFGKDRAAPISPAAVKSAAGAMEHVDLVRATNLVRAIEVLKTAGFWVAALDPHGVTPLWEADLAGRVALVIGSEGRGVRRLVGEHCDLRVRIPVPGPITDLNASVSAAIVLIECLRQRTAAGHGPAGGR